MTDNNINQLFLYNDFTHSENFINVSLILVFIYDNQREE